MPDFKVTFRGDLGNLAQFEQAVGRSAKGMANSVRAANLEIAAASGKIGLNKQGLGRDIIKGSSIVDSINNTFTQSGTIVRRFANGYKLEMDKLGKYKIAPIVDTAYESAFSKRIGNVKQYEEALKNLEPVFDKINSAEKVFALQTAANKNKVSDLTSRREALQSRLLPANNTEIAIAEARASQARKRATQAQLAYDEKPTKQQATVLKKALSELAEFERKVAAAGGKIRAEIEKINADIARLGRQQASAAVYRDKRIAGLQQDPGFGALRAAQNATSPIQSDLATVLRQSEQLRRELLKGGLGAGTRYGTQEFQKALSDQEASVSSYSRNLRTGVRTIQGEFKNLNSGLLEKFTVDLDDNGKVVGRWGGQLSGAGSILRQTVRDFQKVIEWTVATTIVFGTLAAVFSQFQNLNELNNLLARFAITAQTSAEETRAMFSDLAQVAYATATPLIEIITVADDIALATRKAGQSTEEWRKNIIELTTAVGIFTNLTGTETVEAADQLSSAFKQLGIAPGEVIGILNKVTAVAGGQANAIADIVKALSTVSEASRAAGLSVDEQIASVQVLAQVTNKSAADIATAFKNLFGSISSVGSEKILAEFGIEIRDSAGGIKDFLDIYREVAEALEQGVIPQNRLPDVLRGISGGPRRAPDAAALLSNLGRIDEVIAKSANATNEALVANAKVLDTNQAKITQFQNAVNTAVFERFGLAVSELVTALTDLGTTLARFFNGIDPELVNLALKFGIVVGGMRLFGSVMRLVFGGNILTSAANTVRGLSTALQDAGKYANSASIAVGKFNGAGRNAKTGRFESVAGSVFGPGPTPVTSRLGRLGNIAGNNKLAIGAGALAAGGGLAALAGGVDSNTVSSLLQAGGALATLVPGLQGVGIAAILAGTGLQLLAGNSNEVTKSSAELASEVHTLTQAIQATQQEANAFAETQEKSVKVIQNLQNKTKLTAEEQAKLSSATTDYVNATLGLATANEQVSNSFDVLLEKMPEVRKQFSQFKDIALTNKNDPAIKEIQRQLAESILKNSGQNIFAGQPIDLSRQFRPASNQGTTITTMAAAGGFGGERFDLTKLINKPNDLRELFGFRPLETDIAFAARQQSTRDSLLGNDTGVRLIQSAFEQLAEDFREGKSDISEEELKRLNAIVTDLAKSASSFTQNTAALAQQSADIQAKSILGAFTGEQTQNATMANSLATLLNNSLSAAGTPVNPNPDRQATSSQQANLDLIAQLADKANKGLSLTTSELIAVATNVLKLNGVFGELAVGGEQAINEGIVRFLQNAGVTGEALDAIMTQLKVSIDEIGPSLEDLNAVFDDAKQKAAASYGDRLLQLQIADNSGQYEDNAKGLATLRAQNEEAYQSTLQLIDGISQLSGTAFVDFNNALTQVIGLQGEYITQAELTALSNDVNEQGVSALTELQSEFAAKLIEGAVAAGVNADGIEALTGKVFALTGAILTVPPYKKVILEVQTIYSEGGRSGRGGKDTRTQERLVDALKEQAKAEQNGTGQQAVIKKLIDQINAIIRGGTGSNLGGTGSAADKAASAAAAPYNKPSLLDIPEEILKQANYRELVKQAVANARKLQSQVPGETKQNKNDIVELLNGTKKVLETRGVGEEYLRRALDELTGEVKRQNDFLTKADTIRRIRVGGADFSAIANVPVNTKSGVSVGGPQGPINVDLNLNGTVLTPAQFGQFADMVAAAIKKQIAA